MNTFVHFDDNDDVETGESYYKLNYMCFYNLFNKCVGTERPDIGDVQAINKGYDLKLYIS